MNIKGKIKLIKETQVISDKYQKREFVVTTDEQYPQDILVQVSQGKCPIMDNYKVGDKVDVSINIRGREWTNPQGEAKYFNTIEAWRINAQEEVSEEPQAKAPQVEEDDDLPF